MSKWNVFCNENAPYRIYYRQIEIDGYEMYVMFPYNYVVRDYPEDKLKITRACDAAVSAMQSPWQLLDKDTPANL